MVTFERTRMPTIRQGEILGRLRLFLSNLRRRCRYCGGSGLVEKTGQTFTDCEWCNGMYFKYRDFLLCGVPFDYVKISLADISRHYEENCYKKYKILSENVNALLGKCIVLYKGVDSAWGLTSASINLVKEMINAGIDSTYIIFNDFIASLFDFGSDGELNKKNKEMYDYYMSVDCLAIDDISGSTISRSKGDEGFFISKLNNLIMSRKKLNKTTILTFNMTRQLIESVVAASLLDILNKECLWFPVVSKTQKPNAISLLKHENSVLCSVFEPIKSDANTHVIIKKRANVSEICNGGVK
jgi:hypothetical protein